MFRIRLKHKTVCCGGSVSEFFFTRSCCICETDSTERAIERERQGKGWGERVREKELRRTC